MNYSSHAFEVDHGLHFIFIYINPFLQAIIESDPFGIDYKTIEKAKVTGDSFAQKLGEQQAIVQLTLLLAPCISYS